MEIHKDLLTAARHAGRVTPRETFARALRECADPGEFDVEGDLDNDFDRLSKVLLGTPYRPEEAAAFFDAAFLGRQVRRGVTRVTLGQALQQPRDMYIPIVDAFVWCRLRPLLVRAVKVVCAAMREKILQTPEAAWERVVVDGFVPPEGNGCEEFWRHWIIAPLGSRITIYRGHDGDDAEVDSRYEYDDPRRNAETFGQACQFLAEVIQRPPGNQDDAQKDNIHNDDTRQDKTAANKGLGEKHFSISRHKAYTVYFKAGQECKDLENASPRDVYEWLKAHHPERVSQWKRTSFVTMVNAVKNADEPKRSSPRGRKGRNVVDRSQLD